MLNNISNIIQLYWMNAKVSLASKRKDYAKVCWKIESYEKFAGKSGTKNSGGEKFVVFFTLLEHAMIYQTSQQENIFDLFDSV